MSRSPASLTTRSIRSSSGVLGMPSRCSMKVFSSAGSPTLGDAWRSLVAALGGGDGPGVLRGGFLQGSLGQVIQESGQELFVADQEQAKGWLGVAALATQQAHFLQRGGAQVLGLVQNDHGPKPVQLLPALTDGQHVVAAA